MERLIQGFFLLLTIVGCSVAGQKNDLDILIVDGAQNVRKDKLEHSAVIQLSYDVEIPYPGIAISTDKVESLKKHGWRICPASQNQWEQFGDSTVTPPKLVHQRLMSFAKSDAFMMIGTRYLSTLPARGATNAKPDNNTQRVFAIHYDLTVKEIRKQIGPDAEACLGS